jgi:hypothetical protein
VSPEHVLAGHHALQIDIRHTVPTFLAGLDRPPDFDDPNIGVQHVVKVGEA